MENFPPWLTNVLTGAGMAVLTFFLSRRIYTSKADKEDAGTIQILNAVIKDLTRQVKAFIAEVPTWHAKLTDVEEERDKHAKMAGTAMDLAEQRAKEIAKLREDAAVIVEEMSHLSYIADGDDASSIVAKRFRAVKEAAKRME